MDYKINVNGLVSTYANMLKQCVEHGNDHYVLKYWDN